jgi:Holliday junction resolvase
MHKRIDKNQNQIVKVLRHLGASVAITSMTGNGFPDLVIGIGKKNYLIELKSSDKAQLTDCEKKFHDEWKGQICIINNINEVVDFIKLIR